MRASPHQTTTNQIAISAHALPLSECSVDGQCLRDLRAPLVGEGAGGEGSNPRDHPLAPSTHFHPTISPMNPYQPSRAFFCPILPSADGEGGTPPPYIHTLSIHCVPFRGYFG